MSRNSRFFGRFVILSHPVILSEAKNLSAKNLARKGNFCIFEKCSTRLSFCATLSF